MESARATSTTSLISLQASFGSTDELADAMQGWDLDLRQLDRGQGCAQLALASTPSVVIHQVRFARSVHQRGAPPEGFRTFGILTSQQGDVLWNHTPIGNETIEAFLPGSEYDTVAPPGFEAFVVSVKEDYLARMAQRNGLMEPEHLVQHRVTQVERSRVQGLKSSLLSLLRSGESRLNAAGPDKVIELLIDAYGAGSVREISDPGRRTRWLRRALEYIEAHPRQPVTVNEVSAAAGCSPRTLERAFTDHFDLPPKTYLLIRRLNGVRCELRRAHPGSKVADHANHWGFWHMGQFAADYRALFGELPSQTLAACR